MRKTFVECTTRYQAQKECPWAEHFMKVVDGYQCFESIEDFRIARNQK
jgi:hypothetical protein